MDALNVIQKEHRAIAAVVHCLDQLLREVREGELAPPVDVFTLIVEYVRDFPDRFHHPKEDDYLFVALAKREPKLKKIIDDLKRQHHEGQERTARLLEQLEVLRKDPQGGFADFEKAAQEFVEFQRGHISLEEGKILPAARKALTDEDWTHIDAAFADNEDPVFGASPRAKYDKLFSSIVAAAPEPWGLKSRPAPAPKDDESLWHKFREKVLHQDWH